jgi:predicted transcriptional regulator YheO
LNYKPTITQTIRVGKKECLRLESQSAIEKATIAEALYQSGTIPVKKIAEQLDISKTTLYLYLRYRNVCIGAKKGI